LGIKPKKIDTLLNRNGHAKFFKQEAIFSKIKVREIVYTLKPHKEVFTITNKGNVSSITI
jgi:hypothetical protein